MLKPYVKIPSPTDPNVQLKVIDGHFAASHAHLNHYIDITTMKSRSNEAHGVAELVARRFSYGTPVDTIVCLDGMEVVGAYLADELTKAGILSTNAHKTLYVISPEHNSQGQILVRDNIQLAVRGKNVLLLMGIVSSGATLEVAMQSLKYYGAIISGAACIFSVPDAAAGVEIVAAFHPEDVPDYQFYAPHNCPLCKAGVRIDALVNSYGYSEL